MRLQRWLYTLPLRLRSLFQRNQVEQELDEELRYHIDRLTDEHVTRGMDPGDARVAALRAMHGVEQRKEECRDARGVRLIEDAVQDLQYAVRTLVRSPGFAAAAIATLTLGIGASVAMFSVVNGVLLRPLPFPQPEQLFLLMHSPQGPMIRQPSMSDADYVAFREADRSFEHVAAFSNYSGNLVGAGDPAVVSVGRVTAEFFDVFRIPPALGRAFVRDDEKQAGRPIILSDQLWRSRFAADRRIIGQAITLDGEPRMVIGVMPAGFSFPRDTDAWTLYAVTLDPHRGWATPVVGRLKAGVTRAQAEAQFGTVARHLSNWSGERLVSGLRPLEELLVGDVRRPIQVFTAAVLFVLLIACANVANLLFARATRREREIAVRAAIGAGRGRLVRQLLTESLLLSIAGGVLGITLAQWAVSALIALAPAGRIPRLELVRVDGPIVVFAAGLSLITAIVFGGAPALRMTRRGSHQSLAPGLRHSVRSQERLRAFLVVAEIALALMLLIGAGLLLQSFLRLRAVDPGFHPRGVMTMTVDLPESTYATSEKMRAFHGALLDRLAGLPGAIGASAVNWQPLGSMLIHGDFQIEGPRASAADFTADKLAVSPRYFTIMGIRLLRGRDFSAGDSTASTRVSVLSETVARLLEPSGDAVGRRITLEDHPTPEDWLTVVGVVDDVRQWGPAQPLHAAIYQPYTQVDKSFFLGHMTFAVRTAADPVALAPEMRRALRAVDSNQPAASMVMMEDVLAAATAEPRFQARLLGIFALLALILALIGTYGVLAYSVAQGTHEIGVRMALGARSGTLVWMVLRRTLLLSAIGISIGLAGALATTRLMGALLFEITPTDPGTLTAVTLAILIASLAAGFIPAQRAARVDPLVALRHE